MFQKLLRFRLYNVVGRTYSERIQNLHTQGAIYNMNIMNYKTEKIIPIKLPSVNLPCTQLNLPSKQNFLEIFDSVPLANINLPSVFITTMDLPTSINEEVVQCKGGLLRIRRKKMNKHKLKKRRKRDRAKIRKVLMGRDKQKRKKRAKRKIRIQEKIEKLLQQNPKSTYAERPYVIHRLKNW